MEREFQPRKVICDLCGLDAGNEAWALCYDCWSDLGAPANAKELTTQLLNASFPVRYRIMRRRAGLET